MLSISPLAEEIGGQIITPEHPAYDQARTVFNGAFDRRPALIVRVADADDVARVIALARESGLPLAVRGGGHSAAGHGIVDDGIVLDLSAMRALEIDPERRTAWAETGLTAGEYTTAAGAFGLATGFGDMGSVGIGGITLSGGVGLLVRKHGLTIDDLLAADVVTADGELLRVDVENHPDLFWAIRGGGGNFGVATRLQFRLHEVGTVVGGMLFLPATPDVIASFIAAAEAAPDELSTIANVMHAPPLPFLAPEHHGRLVVMATLAYAGDVEAGERAVEPFRALATPIADMVRPMPYPALFPPEDESYRRRGRSHGIRRARRPRRRGDDPRAHPGLGRIQSGRAAARPRRRDGARARRRDRLCAPRAPHPGERRRALRGRRGAAAPPGVGHRPRERAGPG